MDKNSMDVIVEDQSVIRTEMAHERTMLANERTFIAWLRTGLALTAGAAVVTRLLGDFEPAWLVDILAVVLVFTGTGIVLVSAWGYQKVAESMGGEITRLIPSWLVWILVLAIQAAAISIFSLFILG